ncbi:MAG TPA: hypothetical protein VMY35_19960 [Phycisphaerae bacterium]|nr:hypothetical protein [Phycisphaerae bacterium]
MSDIFYKVGRAMLARTDLTPAEKLVRIVRDHWLAFEGKEPTAAEAARATGLGERTVRRFLAAKLAAAKMAKMAKMPAKLAGETANLATPNVIKTSVRDVEKERGIITDPLPLLSRCGKEEKTDGLAEAAAKAGEQGGMLAMLVLKARAGGGKWSLARWIGQVEEDEAAGRYRRPDLEVYVAARTAITEAPWKLAEAVRRHAAAAKEAAFRERLRRIRADGLTRAEGPVAAGDSTWRDGPGRVVYVDPDMPLLVIEQPRPAVPGTSYGPGKKRWNVTTPADLAGWRFRAEQPTLF